MVEAAPYAKNISKDAVPATGKGNAVGFLDSYYGTQPSFDIHTFSQLFVSPLASVAMAYGVVWWVMRRGFVRKLRRKWHIIGIAVALVGGAIFRLIAAFTFAGYYSAIYPRADTGALGFYYILIPALIAVGYLYLLKHRPNGQSIYDSESLTSSSPMPSLQSATVSRQTGTADGIPASHSQSAALPFAPSSPMNNQPITSTLAVDEDAVYEVVANEMDSGKMDKGLWTRLFAELDGDEKKTKIAYIKQRAAKLMIAERARLQELEKLRIEKAAAEENAQSEQEKAEYVRSLAVKQGRLRKIRLAAEQHKNNPRLTIDEKADLLRLAEGDFKCIDGYGKCLATFRGRERQFSSGKDFSNWFIAEVIPFLLTIEPSES